MSLNNLQKSESRIPKEVDYIPKEIQSKLDDSSEIKEAVYKSGLIGWIGGAYEKFSIAEKIHSKNGSNTKCNPMSSLLNCNLDEKDWEKVVLKLAEDNGISLDEVKIKQLLSCRNKNGLFDKSDYQETIYTFKDSLDKNFIDLLFRNGLLSIPSFGIQYKIEKLAAELKKIASHKSKSYALLQMVPGLFLTTSYGGDYMKLAIGLLLVVSGYATFKLRKKNIEENLVRNLGEGL